MDSDSNPSGVDLVDKLAEQYLLRRRRGEHPTPEEYAERHPELASRILDLFPALEVIEVLKPTAQDFAPPAGSERDASVSGRSEPARRLSDYTLLRELGRGGMGIVYEAEHDSLKNRVALKVMHPRFRADSGYLRRFQTEARSAARLHHTNIVPVFDYGEQDGVCFYAMQFIAGVGLDLVVEDVRRLRAEADDAGGAGPDRGGAHGATEPLGDPRSAATCGLLTGRFAAAPTGPGAPGPGPTAPLDAGGPHEVASGIASDRPPPGPCSSEVAGGSSSRSFAGQPESAYFREIARLGAQAADALDFAHRQSVVHRDIKPSNLLLDPYGNVWVTDFGLAKLLEGDELSQSHDLVGTLRFMAPERFRGVTTPQGDVYSLGATLYELLALKPAFGERDQARLIDQITHEMSAPLRQHDRRIPRDLETLVQKALAKDPKDRFATAAELGDELRRYLESRPIRSRPIGPVERLCRWSRRNPGLAAASILAASLATALVIGSTVAAVVFRQDNLRIQSADRKIKEALVDSSAAQAQARRFSKHVGQRFESLRALERAAELARELNLPADRFDALRDEAIACLALPDLEKTGRVITRPAGAFLVAFDRTMTRYALRFSDKIEIRRIADDVELAQFPAQGHGGIYVFGFSPDGRYLASTHWPGLDLKVWDVERGTVAVNDPGRVYWGAAHFSPNSRRIAVSHENGEFLIYDLASGQPGPQWRGQAITNAVFSPDGTQIAALDQDGRVTRSVRILEAETGRLVGSFPIPNLILECGAWSPDGTTLATPCLDVKIYLWDVQSGTRKAILEGHTNAGLQAAFHPAGTLLASNGWESRLRLWDAVMGRPVLTLTGTNPKVDFSQDGRIVVWLGDQLTTYRADPALEYRTLAHVSSERTIYMRAAIRRDGRIMALGTDKGAVLWDLARGTELAVLPIGMAGHLIFEPSGDLITSGACGVWRWPVHLDLDHAELRVGPPTQLSFPAGHCGIDVDRSGQAVALANHVTAWVATSGRTIQVGPLDDCRDVAVSPDGQWLATGRFTGPGGKGGALVWRVSDASLVAEMPGEGNTPVFFSPDGKWLMTTQTPCRLWTVGTWEQARQIDGVGMCFSPDGRLVVSRDSSNALNLVEVETGRKLARLESPDSCGVGWVSFSPDGGRLVITTADGPAVHVWDLRAIRKRLARLGLDWEAPAYANQDPASAELAPLPRVKIEGRTPVPWVVDAKVFEQQIADLEAALLRSPGQSHIQFPLAECCNNFAWMLVASPGSPHDAQRAISLVRRAEELAPDKSFFLNTLGVAQYRAGEHAEALATLEKSVAAGNGAVDPFDLFFLAMARHKLRQFDQGRADFDRAIKWRQEHRKLPDWYRAVLDAFEAEARSVMDGPASVLPANVFGPKASSPP
jgi:serine/threonine protein kinase/WD40 repeat protein